MIADELDAEAQIAANPSRAIKPPIDPDLYAIRHEIENFFQRIERFRRIALRCEKTLAGFMGFVYLVSALDRLRRMQTDPSGRGRTAATSTSSSISGTS